MPSEEEDKTEMIEDALNLGLTRLYAMDSALLNEHFYGDFATNFGLIEEALARASKKLFDQLREGGDDSLTSAHVAGKQMLIGAFLLGRSFEETSLSALAAKGALNHLCTKCHGNGCAHKAAA
jgi:hypothetical protein